MEGKCSGELSARGVAARVACVHASMILVHERVQGEWFSEKSLVYKSSKSQGIGFRVQDSEFRILSFWALI
jgi:hypothetical protein